MVVQVIEEKTLGAEDTNINELRKLRDELTQQRDNLQLEVTATVSIFEDLCHQIFIRCQS